MAILEISTVVGCRMGCDYCPQTLHAQSRAGDSVMSLATFQECLSVVPLSAAVCFAGMAEPFLNPDAVSMVEHAYRNGHLVDVFTTGAGLSLADVDRLAKVRYRHFCLHLPDAAGRMKLTVTTEYLEVLEYLVYRLKTTRMCIGTVNPLVAGVIGGCVDGTGSLQSRAGNLGVTVRHAGPVECSASPELMHNVLLPNGDVVLCCMDYGRRHVLGNLLRDSWLGLDRLTVRGMQVVPGSGVLCQTCECARAA